MIDMADAVVVVPTPARMRPIAYATTLRTICHQGLFSSVDMVQCFLLVFKAQKYAI